MVNRYSKRQKEALWSSWVSKPIFGDGGVVNIAPRHVIIHQFVEKGIFPFVKRKGYIFSNNAPRVTKSLLHYMFALYLGEKVRFVNSHKGILKDHVDEFEHRFDSLEIEEFWEQWNSIQDFQDGSYASCLQHTLPGFLWYHINIEQSPITLKIESILDEIEEQEEYERRKKDTKAKEDAYLQETSRVNYEDRHWH